MLIRLGAVVIALLGLAVVSSGVRAAPQVLALIATAEPVPLVCAGSECSAEFSAICLQPDRASPTPGKAYTPVVAGGAPGGIELVAEMTDGATRRLSWTDLAAVTAERGHNAVKISIDRRRLERMGVKSVRVAVADMVSLVPVPIAGDTNPMSEGEIALATGPLRTLADRVVDKGGLHLEAARMTNWVINALPPRGLSTDGQRDAAWAKAARQFGDRLSQRRSPGRGRHSRIAAKSRRSACSPCAAAWVRSTTA